METIESSKKTIVLYARQLFKAEYKIRSQGIKLQSKLPNLVQHPLDVDINVINEGKWAITDRSADHFLSTPLVSYTSFIRNFNEIPHDNSFTSTDDVKHELLLSILISHPFTLL